jgi:hypothetical protein
MTQGIRVLMGGEVRTVPVADPCETVLEWLRRTGLSVRRWIRLSALRAFGEATLDISRVGDESPDEDRGLIRAATGNEDVEVR